VRSSIEATLERMGDEPYAVIDFGTVRCMDFSCADEIVGKLLREHGAARYFFLHGVTASHCDAIEHVLARHQLAVVARDREGRVRVLGPIPDKARQALSVLAENGLATPDELADHLAASEMDLLDTTSGPTPRATE
jgi:hypothetical protein